MYTSVIFYPHLFCEGSRKQPKYFPAQTPSYGKCPMVSCTPSTVHLRPPTVHLFLAMPPTDSPHRSSYAPSKLPPVPSNAPTKLSTYVQLCPPPTVHYRCPRFLPPAPPADVVAIMKGCLQDIYVLYIHIYVPTGLQKNITNNSPHNNSTHLADDQGGYQ